MVNTHFFSVYAANFAGLVPKISYLIKGKTVFFSYVISKLV